MLFTSYEFLGFILLIFVLYYVVPKKFQWILLLAFSYIFYFIANPYYLVYIIVTTVTIYFLGCRIEKLHEERKLYLKAHKESLGKEEKKAYKNEIKRKQNRLLLLALLINLGILAVVKYSNFAIVNVNALLHFFGSGKEFGVLDLLLPMGISFYTFQAVGYLIDVYRETCPAQKNLFKFALFVSFFPQ